MPGTIYHILPADRWQQAQADGIYQPSSLECEGFIHCSTPAQVVATANRFFAGQTALLLLAIARDRVTAPVRDDFVAAENQTFPHIWGPLNLEAVEGAIPLVAGADGNFPLPAELAG